MDISPLVTRLAESTVAGAVLALVILALMHGRVITVKHHLDVIAGLERLIAELTAEREFWRKKRGGTHAKNRPTR